MYAREEKEGRSRDLGERRNTDFSIKSTTQGGTTVTICGRLPGQKTRQVTCATLQWGSALAANTACQSNTISIHSLPIFLFP